MDDVSSKFASLCSGDVAEAAERALAVAAPEARGDGTYAMRTHTDIAKVLMAEGWIREEVEMPTLCRALSHFFVKAGYRQIERKPRPGGQVSKPFSQKREQAPRKEASSEKASEKEAAFLITLLQLKELLVLPPSAVLNKAAIHIIELAVDG